MKEVFMITRMAIQFFTVLPVAKTIEWTERRTAKTIFYLPLLGIVIACMFFYTMNVFANLQMSTSVVSLLLILVPIVFTGGLHVDGYMDVSDAYFSRQSKEAKLHILSDPHVGSFAILSLLFLLGLRWMSIHELLTYSEITMWNVILIFSLPRLVGGWLLIIEKPAKETGLAAYFQRGVTKHIIRLYVCMSILLLAALFFMIDNKLVFLAYGLFTVGFIRFIRVNFGGITGDVIGTSIEGGETFLWITLWLLHVFVMG
ncbi:adenosylcobinamide-GDP ribazoletransferase [Metabacillus iocasae]|uniref:Adenosylcobinamide-GDP ribazoletransferase n=1 Tax=Priestia iocasae TaxID=2291674 RepID=A0ABS2QSI6_9BACI|nr:adenosylcobinamide-GDP ribazoletransferase [Metabacillus iocasae]MBM7701992.1 adenosylcobinamide-GDP ribazoletransferase [Metabacillus iocasae]